MSLKIYGVIGLTEWKPIIKAGKATFSPLFAGGAMSAYGVTPARYRTDNPIFQNIIEKSDYFKSGRIILLSTEEEKTINKPVRKAQVSEADAVSIGARETDNDKPQDEETSELKKVEVTDIQSAKAYLIEAFNIKSSLLRSGKAVQEQALAHGVEFIGLEE